MTARPRPLVAGLGLAVVYVLVALVTPRLTGRPLLPLFDGFAPPAPYNWVNPPPGLEDDNSPPAEASQDVELDEDGSKASNATTTDGQAIVGFDTGSLPPNPPDTSVLVRVSPVDAATLAPLPGGLRAEGNAYRVTLAYQPSGQVVTALARPGTIALTAAAPATALLFSPDGSQWQEIDARPFGDSNGLFAPLTEPGLYLSSSHNPARTAGSSGDGGGGGSGGIVVAVLIIAIIGVALGLLAGTRRRRTGAKGAAKKGRGSAKKKGSGSKSKGKGRPNRRRR